MKHINEEDNTNGESVRHHIPQMLTLPTVII